MSNPLLSGDDDQTAYQTNTKAEEPLSRTETTRRGALKAAATVGAGITGIGTLSGAASAAFTPGSSGGDDPPYYYHERATHSSESGAFDFLKVDHTTTIMWEDPKYDDDLGTDVIFFQVDTEAAAYRDGDPSDLRGFIDNVETEVTYPDNEVVSGSSHNWIGGMSNYTEPEDTTTTEYAENIVSQALGYVPYASKVASATQTVSSLTQLPGSSEGSDSTNRMWNFSNAERINTWSRYKAEVGDGEEYTIQIDDQLYSPMGGNNTFKIQFSNK
jgi:hypothetical protein